MITSTANAQIKQIMKLHKSSRERKKTGLFVVEGIRMFSEVPKQDFTMAYVTEMFYEAHKEMFADRSYELVSESVFRELSDTITPQGVLSVVRQQAWKLPDILQHDKPLIIALENIQDPGNLGTMIRTAEGAGVTGVIMSRDTVDIYNSKVVRSTMGSIFRVPFVYVDDMVATVKQMQQAGICTYGGHLHGTDLYEEHFEGGTAFFIGNEGNGLTDALSASLDRRIRIPMHGQVESLNAATAATVLVYEALRQRIQEK